MALEGEYAREGRLGRGGDVELHALCKQFSFNELLVSLYLAFGDQ